jgi:sarcosine oxidase
VPAAACRAAAEWAEWAAAGWISDPFVQRETRGRLNGGLFFVDRPRGNGFEQPVASLEARRVSKTFDVIVVGLGAMGSATVFQLAKRGAKVLGIDRFAPPHAFGSSHGDTRVTRLACGEGAQYTPFARRSNEIWRELEQASGQTLLVHNGLLLISGKGPRAQTHGNADFLQTTIDAANAHNVAHELLSDADIRRRFPAFGIADGDRGYFEPTGGFLHPEACIKAQLDEARRLGATLNTDETFRGFEASSGGVTVSTARDTYSAGQVVISAGAWLPKLLPKPMTDLFTVRRQALYWFRIDDKEPLERYRPEAFPVFIWQTPRKQTIYGFPWVGTAVPAIKNATEQYDTTTTADSVERTVSPAEIADMYASYTADFFPGLRNDCIRTAVCMYTCTPDSRFVIDRMPGEQNVIVASPCSGHGFKHSAAIGEAIANLATKGRAAELAPFKWPA